MSSPNEKELASKLQEAKKEGLEAVEKFIYTYESNYYLEAISKRTLTKLLSGKFKSFEEALIYDDTIQDIQTVSIILKKVQHMVNLEPTAVIESIFVGE